MGADAMMQALARLLGRLRRSENGASTIEFAFIAPLMVVLVAIGSDVGRYVYETEQVSRVANTIAQVVTSQSAIGGGGNIQMTGTQLRFTRDSAMLVFPDVLQDSAQQNIAWTNDIGITISSVSFVAAPTGCTAACVYYAKVRWSGGTTARTCTPAGWTPPTPPPITQMADTAAPSPQFIPQDIYPVAPANNAANLLGNVIVVDVTFNYRPLLSGAQWNSAFFNIGTIPIQRSVYVSPRYTPTEIFYVQDATNFASNCP